MSGLYLGKNETLYVIVIEVYKREIWCQALRKEAILYIDMNYLIIIFK